MGILILVSALFCPSLWGWSGHFAVTAAALDRPELAQFLDTKVKVEHLEDFLRTESKAVAKTLDDYYTWLESTGSRRFIKGKLDPSSPSEEGFLKAARLYPETKFRYLSRIFPGEVITGPTLAFATVSPYERLDKNFATTFKEMIGIETTHRAILVTYSDEPDWLMDHDLWSYPSYGYGKKPYGKTGDPASGAAFHMQFAHENFVIKKLVPGISEGMSKDRIELFVRLSRLAYGTNHPYWGSRFAAWAFHYVQDMSQPFHAKALPSETFWYYMKFAFSGNKEKTVQDTTRLVSNRHFLYEDFVRGLLEKHYVSPSGLSRRIYEALSQGEFSFPDLSPQSTGEVLFHRVAALAAKAAYSLDASIQAAYGEKMTEDPSYDMEADPQYDNQAIYQDSQKVESLMKEATLNLFVAARGTRTILGMCRSGF